MSWMKLYISPTLIATLTCSVLASFTAIANAQPTQTIQLAQKYQVIKRVQNTVTIQGNIVKGTERIGAISCSQIKVTLKEFIPTKPVEGQFFNSTEKNLAQVNATGNNIDNGCSYSIQLPEFNRDLYVRPYGASSFQIIAQTNGISGSQTINYPFPNNIDLQVFPPPIIK
ncbi:hypothetical protein [Calothrix sp. PCC 7507]|uniref:hypothetical protein n=1 Tax=Calothrix sp. PCC 7507 TaxID=99598 RepID=UPI00029ED1F9|nr:hypothetical protein [Calothrix sp. PCC 7507]AFY30748.1 hypothetical protein Cal7507_0249 [Calothrix sp. PCC 7507]